MLSLSKIKELASQPRHDDENGRSALDIYLESSLPSHLYSNAFALFFDTALIEGYTLDGLIKRCLKNASKCSRRIRTTGPYGRAAAERATWLELAGNLAA